MVHERPIGIHALGLGVLLLQLPPLGVARRFEEASLTYRGAALIAVFRVVHSSLVTGTMSCLKYHQK